MPSIKTPTLDIHYLEHGAPTGWPVILTHGFPYSPHIYTKVIPHLITAGAHVLVPWVRGFGPTRFLSDTTMRSGQQAALAQDLIDFMDALSIEKAILAGFDWGGVASCMATALHPARVHGLVSYAGYDTMDVVGQQDPVDPTLEAIVWYQHLFQSERGRLCLERSRRELCKLLWQQWSPQWEIEDGVFELTAQGFENPDFVDVVIHAYRFLFGREKGEQGTLQELEDQLTKKPKISVPTITLDGTQDPLKPGGTANHRDLFLGRFERREVDCGHCMPMEKPDVFADAILTMHVWVECRA